MKLALYISILITFILPFKMFEYISTKDSYISSYMVDTIEIVNPVKVYIKEKELYGIIILSKNDLKLLNGKNRFNDLIRLPNIYLYSHNLYNYFDPYKFPKVEECQQKLSNIKITNFEIYEYDPKVNKFSLALILIDEYNSKESSLNSIRIKSKLDHTAYIKVAYPICK
jgi:hypothetical protein